MASSNTRVTKPVRKEAWRVCFVIFVVYIFMRQFCLQLLTLSLLLPQGLKALRHARHHVAGNSAEVAAARTV